MTGTELATYGDDTDYSAGVGLEDTDATDVVLPRLKINGPHATFENSVSGEEFPALYAVVLGLVKQRIMWDKEVEDGDKPMCKSTNFQLGFPNISEDTPRDKRFPWDESNFKPAQMGEDDEGRRYLPCKACAFKEWGENPPRCNEQHTYPLLFTSALDDYGNPLALDQVSENDLTPGILTLQRTGIKPSKSLISTFKTQNKSFFTRWVKVTLNQNKRGAVYYAVPKFQVLDETSRPYWTGWGEQFTQIREFLRRPPRADSDGDDDGEGTEPSPPPAATPAPESTAATAAPKVSTPKVSRPTPAPTVDIDDDDDLPF